MAYKLRTFGCLRKIMNVTDILNESLVPPSHIANHMCHCHTVIQPTHPVE